MAYAILTSVPMLSHTLESHTYPIADWDDGGGAGPLSDDETDYMPLPDAAEPGVYAIVSSLALRPMACQPQSSHHQFDGGLKFTCTRHHFWHRAMIFSLCSTSMGCGWRSTKPGGWRGAQLRGPVPCARGGDHQRCGRGGCADSTGRQVGRAAGVTKDHVSNFARLPWHDIAAGTSQCSSAC